MDRQRFGWSGELRTKRYRYKIESLLGRGGMGVVYRAQQVTEHSQRTVALKLLAPELSGDLNFRQRFMRESQMAMELNHPNIVPVYDADEADGQLLIAMALVEGDDLAIVLRRDAPLEVDRTLNIVRQLGAAIDNAHGLGLVHRDIKPGNAVVVQTDGGENEHVYLLDFGLTKRTSSRSGPTLTGHFVGTLDYAAPEQIEGRVVMSASDRYALGCILVECLTGKPPYVRETDLALLHAHLSEPPPSVHALRPDLPVQIDNVVSRAMAKAPDDRYPTCRDMLHEARTALSTPARSAPARPKQASRSSDSAPIVRTGPTPVPPRPRSRPSRQGPDRARTFRLWFLLAVASLGTGIVIALLLTSLLPQGA